MAAAAAPTESSAEKELAADCTCPVCQELFHRPQLLTACRHTLCKKCIKKMTHKAPDPMEEAAEMSFSLFSGLLRHHHEEKQSKEKSSSVCCPICREVSEKFEPDENIEYLIKVLHALRSQSRCSGDTACLTEATLQCPCCDKRLCQAHFTAQMTALKDSGTALLKDLDLLLTEPDESSSERLQRLQSAAAESLELESVLADQLHRTFADFRQQAELCQEQLRAPLVEDEAERAALFLDRAALRRLTSNGASGKLARLLPESKSRVKSAKTRWPEKQLALQFNPGRLQDQFCSVLAQNASTATFRSPYAQLPNMLTRVGQHSLTQKPWDIGILSNLDGIVCSEGAIKLRSSLKSSCSVKELSGPLLVINAQCFPTKMLHVTDTEVQQVATITPRFGGEGMPGRMHICNERQLILTSDSSRHRVTVFNLEGRIVTSFGEKGSEPRQFHEPLGLGAFDGQMFVVDAKNRRVQVFDMDNDYSCLATIRHDDFTEGIQSVLATGNSVFVADREKSRLSIFDRTSRQPVSQTLKLEDKPFDIVADEFGNALVTLVKEAKLLVVNRFGGVLKCFSFKETSEGRQVPPQLENMPFGLMLPMMGGCPPRMFHGVAFEATGRRLFIADLMRSCIIVTHF